MHIYLFRHGQSIENTQPFDGRNNNSPLTELGEAQAAALGEWVGANLTFDKLYCSTMQRTCQTVAPMAQALSMTDDVVYTDALREVGNALSDGSPFPLDDLPRFKANTWGSLHPYDDITEQGGENWMQFRARIGLFINNCVNDAPNNHRDFQVGMVIHGGVIEGVFEHVFQKGPISTVNIQTNNTGITHLEYFPQKSRPAWWVHYHNRVPHLQADQLS